jgi:uncharacterized protein
MMRISALLFAVVLLLTPGFAQQPAQQTRKAAAPPLPADAPSKEQLMRLFDVMEIQKQMGSMVEAVSSNIEKVMPSGMGELSPSQKTAMESLNNEMFAKMMAPDFIDTYLAAMIPIYQRHFTKTDVDELISFYASPVGRKFLREQPLLTRESLEKVLPLMQNRIQDVMVEIDYEHRLREIFSQQNPAPAEPKK